MIHLFNLQKQSNLALKQNENKKEKYWPILHMNINETFKKIIFAKTCSDI